jgi:hypothetical protein
LYSKRTAINAEIGASDVAGLIGRQKQGCIGLFNRLACIVSAPHPSLERTEAAHGDVDKTTLTLLLRVQKVHEERRAQWTRAQCINANILARMNNRQFARHGQHGALARRIYTII